MSLYNDLNTVLTPYANKIKQNESAVVSMQTATSEDIGKGLIVKTVSGGKVSEWEFGSGQIGDNSITYDMLRKAVIDVPQSKVNFWYYNGEKRTDGTSLEITPPINVPCKFTYPAGTNKYRVYYISDDGTVMLYNEINSDYCRLSEDSNNRTFYFVVLKAGKIYIPLTFGNTRYFPDDTEAIALNKPYPTDFLKEDWQPEIMDIDVKYPRKITFAGKCYNNSGTLLNLRVQIPTYQIYHEGWYKTKEYFTLLDSDWNYIRSGRTSYFYNDGSITYVQGHGTDKDVAPEYIGEGIAAFGGMQVISKGDALDINKPFGHAVVCFGDSITSTGYPEKLAELAKCLAINCGGSGNSSGKIRKVATGIGDEPNVTPFDWSANPVDTAIIMAGYNDTYQGTISGDIPTTTITDAGNDWSAYLALFNASHSASGTTCGNIGFMIEWIQSNHPDVRIVLCNYHNNTDSKPDRYSDVDEAVKALSEYYGIKYIDVRRTSGINKKNAATYLVDGLHPNDAGQIAIAKAILRAM